MTLSDQQRKELKEASKPLIKWLNENCNPHAKVIVDSMSAELKEGVARVVTKEFIKD